MSRIEGLTDLPCYRCQSLHSHTLPLAPLQDCTTRLWDVRNTSRSFATLRSHMGAVRSLRFAPDGDVLAVVEPADFVQLHDVAADYNSLQQVRNKLSTT